MSKRWNYPNGGPQFSTANRFKIYVIGSWFPTNKRSASAWRIDPVAGDEPPIVSARRSMKPGSDSWRATSGGFCTSAEALPNGATADLFCSNEAAVLLLQKIATDPDNEPLRRADGGCVEADEIWQRIVVAIRDKKLTIRAIHVRPNDPELRDIFRWLKRLAKEVAGLI
jgi:hypothetical protein